MTAILEAADLSLGYGEREVIAPLNLALERGTLTGILGPNAAGKSTLIKGLCGLLSPRSGEVRLEGRLVRARGARDVARVLAYVPQRTEIPFSFAAWEIVMMGRTPFFASRVFSGPSPEDARQVEAAMRRTETWDLREETLENLSGGEAQRVIIARALAQSPRLLLLDEPTAHLDPGHERQILDLLCDLNQSENLTILFVSHDLNAVARTASRVLLMSAGGIRADGSPKEVLREDLLSETYGTPLRVMTERESYPVILHR